jgi:hypothetical protein
MTKPRVTETEVGPLVHRDSTELREPRGPCGQGHLAPRYATGGMCVACHRAYLFCRRPVNRRHMQRFADLDAAREAHADAGGWLLDLGNCLYGVTDNEKRVQDLRGKPWLERCEHLQEWDETRLRPARPRQVGHSAEAHAA